MTSKRGTVLALAGQSDTCTVETNPLIYLTPPVAIIFGGVLAWVQPFSGGWIGNYFLGFLLTILLAIELNFILNFAYYRYVWRRLDTPERALYWARWRVMAAGLIGWRLTPEQVAVAATANPVSEYHAVSTTSRLAERLPDADRWWREQAPVNPNFVTTAAMYGRDVPPQAMLDIIISNPDSERDRATDALGTLLLHPAMTTGDLREVADTLHPLSEHSRYLPFVAQALVTHANSDEVTRDIGADLLCANCKKAAGLGLCKKCGKYQITDVDTCSKCRMRCTEPGCSKKAKKGKRCAEHGGITIQYPCKVCGKLGNYSASRLCLKHSPLCSGHKCDTHTGDPSGLCLWHQQNGSGLRKPKNRWRRTKYLYLMWWPEHDAFKVGVELDGETSRMREWVNSGAVLMGIAQLAPGIVDPDQSYALYEAEQELKRAFRDMGYQHPDKKQWLSVVGAKNPHRRQNPDGWTETWLIPGEEADPCGFLMDYIHLIMLESVGDYGAVDVYWWTADGQEHYTHDDAS